MHAPHQRALPMYGQPEPTEDRRPVPFRKAVRDVSRETYNVLADTGALGAATTKVMRSLKAYINKHADYPTPAELARWMFQTGVLKRDNVNTVAPRLTELHIGKIVRRQGQDPARVGGGEIEKLPLRVCRVTGGDAHPVRPVQKGCEGRR
jgi:hypothetical protein